MHAYLSGDGRMKAAVLEGPGNLVVREVVVPDLAPGDLLVKVEACGICPSDVRLWQSGHSDLLSLPAVIGHEAVGTVAAVSEPADGRLLGARVFVDGYGGFAEYAVVTADMIRRQHGPFLLPEQGLSWDEAVFVEPLADCLYAVEYCASASGACTAVVAGCGQMGLQLVRLLSLRGIETTALDPLPHRRALALEFGAVAAAAPECGEPASGVDIAIVACAAPDAVNTCLAALSAGGTCVLFSTLPSAPMLIDVNQIHKRRLTLVGSRWVVGRGEPRYELYRKAIALLAAGQVDIAKLIDMRVGLEGIRASFDDMSQARIMKAVLHPDGDPSPR